MSSGQGYVLTAGTRSAGHFGETLRRRNTRMTEQKYVGRLEPGMDVCDLNGDKVGTINRVYRTDPAAGSFEAGAVATLPREDILEVKTGLLGLGKHYYGRMD